MSPDDPLTRPTEVPLTNWQAAGVLGGLALLVGAVLAAVAYWSP